jgi:uncharacterized membrane protein (TIGR02234 family)
MTVALGGTALGAALVLLAAGQAWAEVTWRRHPSLPPSVLEVTGGTAAPLAPAAALVLLAAGATLLAVRGWGRPAVGLLMVLAGAAAVWASARTLGDADVFTAQLDALGVPPHDWTRDLSPVWPVLATVGGALGAAAGLLAVVRGRRWPGMGRRHERSGAPSAGRRSASAPGEPRAASAWAALDRGEDPTEGPPDRTS